MQIILVLSLAVAAFAAPNNYGHKVEKTEIRIEAPAPVVPIRSSYEAPAPVRSSYEAPVTVRSSYEAPVTVRSSYEAPVTFRSYEAPVTVRAYEAPVIKMSYAAPPVRTSYEAPAPVRSSYEAPVRSSYEAPVRSSYEAPAPVRSSYEAPVRSSYEAPKASYGGYGETKEVQKHIPIVSYNHQDDNKGSYKLDVKTGHGITHSETGSLKDLNSPEGPVGIKAGSYSYTGPDGKLYSVAWTADEHGFHATGDHLPTPPPIPAEIQKSLALPRIKEFQPGFEHLQHEHLTQEVTVKDAGYGGYSSYSQPSLPVRSHY